MQHVNDPIHFITALGLHDVRIDNVAFDIQHMRLELSINDLHANWDGLPDDKGRRPCRLVFSGIGSFFLHATTRDGVYVSSEKISSTESEYELVLDLGQAASELNGDGGKLILTFQSLAVIDAPASS